MNKFPDDICEALFNAGVPLDSWSIAKELWTRGMDVSNQPDWPEQIFRMLACLVDAGRIERLDHPRAIEYAAIPRAQQLLARYESTPH